MKQSIKSLSKGKLRRKLDKQQKIAKAKLVRDLENLYDRLIKDMSDALERKFKDGSIN